MAKLLIQYNKKPYNWTVYIDKRLFFTYYIKINKKSAISKISKISLSYLTLLSILRNFGLVKTLKNLKEFN